MRSSRVLVLLAALVAACGDAGAIVPIAPRTATLEELTGPWRPTPLVLDADWRSRIETACWRDMQVAGGALVAVIDARGAGVVTVRLSGAGMAKCDALEVTPTGQVAGAGGGMSGGQEETRQPADGSLGAVEPGFVLGGALKVQGWSVTGRAGRGIERVEVATTTHPPITATLENGWYAAWWPAARGDRRPEQGVLPDFAVRGYDAGGTLISER